jgi:hypothetical protein
MKFADWNWYLPSWEWHKLGSVDWPGWELNRDLDVPEPFSVVFSFIRKGENARSRVIATEWDDLTSSSFYYRDWTVDNLPFVREGEIYWSAFWFQCKDEAVRFQKFFGGIGSWMEGYEAALVKRTREWKS